MTVRPTVRVPRVLSIAGTDPTGGAGIQADLKSIAANGGYGMAVVTSLVAQNTTGVRAVHTPPPAFLREQLDAVAQDVTIDAVKIGMLFDVDTVTTVTNWLTTVRPPRVVLDPVMVATSGPRLLRADAEGALRALAARADVVDLITPNVPELAILVGAPPASDWAGVVAQAGELAQRSGVAVLAKGGHLRSERTGPDLVRDALVVPGRPVREFTAPRVDTPHTHGTGCSLSSAVATLAARRDDWAVAIEEAKRWLTDAVTAGADLHVGRGRGPISHLAPLWRCAGTHA